jgi:hypothetical protein
MALLASIARADARANPAPGPNTSPSASDPLPALLERLVPEAGLEHPVRHSWRFFGIYEIGTEVNPQLGFPTGSGVRVTQNRIGTTNHPIALSRTRGADSWGARIDVFGGAYRLGQANVSVSYFAQARFDLGEATPVGERRWGLEFSVSGPPGTQYASGTAFIYIRERPVEWRRCARPRGAAFPLPSPTY